MVCEGATCSVDSQIQQSRNCSLFSVLGNFFSIIRFNANRKFCSLSLVLFIDDDNSFQRFAIAPDIAVSLGSGIGIDFLASLANNPAPCLISVIAFLARRIRVCSTSISIISGNKTYPPSLARAYINASPTAEVNISSATQTFVSGSTHHDGALNASMSPSRAASQFFEYRVGR